MKKKWIQTVCCLFGAGAICFLLWFSSYVSRDKISFSAEPGFYEEDFYLEIRGGGTVYYTTDCTEPDENSLKYTGPILISDASEKSNIYSDVSDVYLGFDERLLDKAVLINENYTIPDYPVDKATVIRAVSIDSRGRKSDVITGVYFTGYEKKQGYDNIGIISIVTEPDGLFGYENGIYVAGKVFDDYYNSLSGEKTFDSYLTWNPANYHMSGEDWERSAEITFWNSDREIIEQGTYGIRLQGAGSRAWLPKNFNIYERKDRYKNSELDGTALGFDNDVDCLNLFGGSQDNLSLCKDWLVNDLTDELKFPHTGFIPYALFLDGEYWGMYLIKEDMDSYYFKQKYRLDEVTVISDKGLENGRSLEMEKYDELMDFVRDNDLSLKKNYDYIGQHFDMDSLIDYYAVEIYICNIDWPTYNYALWKPAGNEKYRFMLFDVNDAMDKVYADCDTVTETIVKDSFFAGLMDNEEFEKKLNERLVYLAENTFNPDRVNAFIDLYEDKMTDPMINDYRRYFGDNYNDKDFIKNCEDIKEFFKLRHDYILKEN